MTRTRTLLVVSLAAATVAGCTKSDEPTEATRAAGDLMPAGAPIDPSFVADQGSVKLALSREVPSYEPLETFRKERAEVKPIKRHSIEELKKAATERPAKMAKSTPESGGATGSPGAGSEGGFWKRLGGKVLMGGAHGAATPPTKSDEAKSSSEDDTGKDDAASDDDSVDDSDDSAEDDDSDSGDEDE